MLAIGLATSFVALAVALAWALPLCCIDDALFAVVARNLASGRGYVVAIEPVLAPFPARVATGPTSILPAAAAIAVLGPDPRVPGLAHVLLWIGLLGLVLRSATRIGASPWALLAAFVALQLATSARHFEQWHALLGEVPAALLVILGAALLARDEAAARHAFASGLAFSAAILGKLLTLLYLAGPIVLLARGLRRREESSSTGVRRGLAFLAGLLALHAAYELWRLSALGATGWWENLRELGSFIAAYGVGDGPAAGWAELARRSALLDERFVLPPLLFAATIAVAGFASRELPRAARRFILLLLLGAGVQLLYWLLLSDGRPRYAFVASVVWGFALAFLVATVRSRPLRLAVAALLAWPLATGAPRLERPLGLLAEARRPEMSQLATAAEAMANVIRTRTDGAPIGAPGWGHVAALAYLLDEPGRFRIALGPERSVDWLIVDDRLPSARSWGFAALLAECSRTVARRAPYTLRRCVDD